MIIIVNMNEICAIIDVQGFNLEEKFVVREFAICSDVLTQTQELNPNKHWKNYSPKDQEIIKHCTKFVHGLYYCPFNDMEYAFLPHSDNIGSIIKTYYEMIATPEKAKLGFKNQFLRKILAEQNIPSIDLDNPIYEIPSIKIIEQIFGNNYHCGIHNKRPLRDPDTGKIIPFRCAYRKVSNLWRFLKNKQLEEMS